MSKILLVSMPFGALERPALGLSLLKARLEQERLQCDVRYLTFAFAEYIGLDEYQWMSYHLPYTAFAGDWAFTSALYGERPEADRTYVQEILSKMWRLSHEDIARIIRVRRFVPHFLEYCLAAERWGDYALVGFTSTFEQNIASLALARRIKTNHPDVKIAFGGANWEGEMGQELHRQFRFVDYVCSGESEQSLAALAQHAIQQPSCDLSLTSVPGLVFRAADGGSVVTGPASSIRDMDTLPFPDFGDYFRDLQQCTVSAPIVPTLLFETSRGCWWGAKSHCTFCGLNGQAMTFRSKSAGRALHELEYLVGRWQVENVEVVDNILDMKYFKDLLPALAQRDRPLQLFYEVKANLSKAQVRMLREAGVSRIQPGIESLNDHVLQLMRKGTTALRNIQLLKWAQQYGVVVEWNILYGFPGETPDDYAAMLELLAAIRFLRPPCATGPIRLDRFSPYHSSPAEFGLTNVRPMAIYSHLYPFDGDSLQRIAYYFDFDYVCGSDPTGHADQVIAFANRWQRDTSTGILTCMMCPDGRVTLMDTRPERTIDSVTFDELQGAAYAFCDELHTLDGVARHLRATFPTREFSDGQLRSFLDSLVANRLMVCDGRNYLSLAIWTALPTTSTATPEVDMYSETADSRSRGIALRSIPQTGATG